MKVKFELTVEADEEMGFTSVEILEDHISEAIRNAGDAGLSFKLVEIPEKVKEVEVKTKNQHTQVLRSAATAIFSLIGVIAVFLFILYGPVFAEQPAVFTVFMLVVFACMFVVSVFALVINAEYAITASKKSVKSS